MITDWRSPTTRRAARSNSPNKLGAMQLLAKGADGMSQRSTRSSMVSGRGRNSLKSSHGFEDVERRKNRVPGKAGAIETNSQHGLAANYAGPQPDPAGILAPFTDKLAPRYQYSQCDWPHVPLAAGVQVVHSTFVPRPQIRMDWWRIQGLSKRVRLQGQQSEDSYNDHTAFALREKPKPLPREQPSCSMGS